VGGGEKVKNIDVNKTPLGTSTEAIGYYLAGLFALNIAIVNQQMPNLVLLIVGAILCIYGFVLLLNPVWGILDKIPNIIRMYAIITLLSVCGAQLATFAAGTLFMIPSLIFLALFIFVIIFTSRSVFQKRRHLLTIFITLLVIAFIQFFLVDNSLRWDRWDLYFILLLELIIIGFLFKVNLKSKRNRINTSNKD